MNRSSPNISSLERVCPCTASSTASGCRSNCDERASRSSSSGSLSPSQTNPSPAQASRAATVMLSTGFRTPLTYQAQAITELGRGVGCIATTGAGGRLLKDPTVGR